METKEVTHGAIRDWLVVQIASIVKCPPSDVGVEERFTALGLDSLSMLTLTGDLAAWLGRDLPATLLLSHSTIEELAEHLAEMGPDEMAPAPPRGIDTPIPVTFAQERLLKHASLPPNRDANLLDPRYILRGSLDLEALQRALTEMVRRHEILRTTFSRRDGAFVQVVHPPEAAVLDMVEWSADEETQCEKQLAARARAFLVRPVDLSSLPLFRTLVVKVAEDDYRLLFLFHHLLTDAEALRVFYGDLSRLYSAYCKNFEPALEPLEWQYADFALWERNWLRKDGSAYRDRMEWWREYWRTPPRRPEFAFARKHAPAEPPPPSACMLAVVIDEETRSRAEALARQCQATMYTVLLSAFAWHLLRHTHERDVVIGTYVTDRKRVAAGQLLGMFTSMVPIRVAARQGMTFREQARQLQQHLDSMALHRELPFEHLVERLEAEGGAVPEVHTVFQQVESLEGVLQLEGLQAEGWKVDVSSEMDSGLSFTILKAPGTTSARISFDGAKYDPAAMQAFLTTFVEALHHLVSAPDEFPESQVVTPVEWDWQHLFGPG